MKIEYKGISIPLTQEQIKYIKSELDSKEEFKTFYDITSIQKAAMFLNVKIPDKTVDQIQLVAKTISMLDHTKPIYNYCPYFYYGDSGLVFGGSCCRTSASVAEVAYFKSEESSNHIGKTFIYLYNKLYNETKII